MPGSFINTNVLIQIASADPVKSDKAQRIIAMGGSISVQVLNEIATVARRKMQLSWTETHTLLDSLRRLLTVHPLTVHTHDTGLAIAERYGLSFDDSMIAATAIDAGCETLWSEDMHNGLVINNDLRIINPFRETD